MLNFNFRNPTRIVFGNGTIKELSNLIDKNHKVLITYGGGSIKKNGVYQQVKEALKDYDVVEFGGIEVNPLYETCMQAVKFAKEENVTFLLSVGGGSVLDATKFIASAIEFDGNAWDIVTSGGEKVISATPFGDVITLPATGSEMNSNSVISRADTKEKCAFSSPCIYPQFSILDPETTYSLPKKQLVNGIVDAYIHVIEQYMNDDVNSPLQDKQLIAILSTLIEIAPKVLQDEPDYDSRANFMWSATNALNGWASCGVQQDWSTHYIGHELTAIYGIDHAQSLAIVLPGLWKADKNNKKIKLLQYAKMVFGITANDENEAIDKAILKTVEFFESLGMKTTFSDYGIDAADAAKQVSERFKSRELVIGVHQNITPNEIYKILSAR